MKANEEYEMEPAERDYWLAQVAHLVDDLDPVAVGLVERAQFLIAVAG